MRSLLITLLVLSFFYISCSKDKDTKVNKIQEQKTSDVKSSGLYYPIVNINDSKEKYQFVDFSWTENGEVKKLSDYKGKVILLNFWATWCPPCKKELPDLSSISKDLSTRDFKIIGISVDENPAALETYLKTYSLPYTIVHEQQGNLLNMYMSVTGGSQNVIPQTFIIDKKGKIVESIIGSRSKQDFLSMINKYL
jgi:cytochrome c-type biogenesis protein